MNETYVTMTGNVVGDPIVRYTKNGARFVTFRLASTSRRFDAQAGAYVDAGTNFVDVAAFRDLAVNIVESIRKGHPVVVTGRLRVNEWQRDERRGVSVQVEAQAVGHDLNRGQCRFTRVRHGEEIEGTNPVRLPERSWPTASPTEQEPGADDGWETTDADDAAAYDEETSYDVNELREEPIAV